MVHGRGCNLHRSLWRHWWRHNSETIRDRENGDHLSPWNHLSYPMVKTASLYGVYDNFCKTGNYVSHLWHHSLGSRWKLQKMARENFSIGAFYNIMKNQDNPIKTVGRDSFLSPKTPKNTSFFRGHPAPQGSHSPYILGDTTRPRHKRMS